MKPIEVIVVPTAGPSRRETVKPDDLPWFQRTVGGYIEVVRVPDGLMVINEEGKLQRLDPNVIATRLYQADLIVGDAVLIGPAPDDAGEFTSVSPLLAELEALIEGTFGEDPGVR